MTRKIVHFLSISLACFIMAGCSASGTTVCNLSGTITDENGNALSGITVVLADNSTYTTTTDAAGNYSFDSVNCGTFTLIIPQSQTYQFLPTNRQVVVENRDLDDIDFVGINQTQPAQFNYSHTFDEGSGIPTSSGAETNDSTTRVFDDTAGLFGYFHHIYMDAYGLAMSDYQGGSFSVSEVPLNSYSEITFKFKEMNIAEDLKNQMDLPERIPIYFQLFRVDEPSQALTEMSAVTTGAFVDKNNDVIFHFGGNMVNMGQASSWWNVECRQVLKFYGNALQSEVYKNGNLVHYSQECLHFASGAIGTHMVTYLSQGVTIGKIAFAEQSQTPFTPRPAIQDAWIGEPFVEPNLSWNYAHLFEEGSGVPTIDGAEINDSATRTLSVHGNAVLDAYGLSSSDGKETFLYLSETPENFRAEAVFKLTGQSDNNLAVGIAKIPDDLSGQLFVGIAAEDDLLGGGNEKVLYLTIVTDEEDGPQCAYNVGKVSDWMDMECRIVLELFEDYLQLKLFKENSLKGRVQLRSLDAASFSLFTLSGPMFTGACSVREYRFSELTEAPFTGTGEKPLNLWEYVSYQDFTKKSGLLSYNPAQYRLTGLITAWNWSFPGAAYSPDYSPLMVEGRGVQGTTEEFRAHSNYAGGGPIEAYVEWPLNPDSNMIFELGVHGYAVQYVQATQTLNIVNYGLPDVAWWENSEPLPPVSTNVQTVATQPVSFTPGQTYRFKVLVSKTKTDVYVDDVWMLSGTYSFSGSLIVQCFMRGVHCDGLYIKTFAIKGNLEEISFFTSGASGCRSVRSGRDF